MCISGIYTTSDSLASNLHQPVLWPIEKKQSKGRVSSPNLELPAKQFGPISVSDLARPFSSTWVHVSLIQVLGKEWEGGVERMLEIQK